MLSSTPTGVRTLPEKKDSRHPQNPKSLTSHTLSGVDCTVCIRTLRNEHSVLSSASQELRCADHSASASRLLPPPFWWECLGASVKFDHN